MTRAEDQVLARLGGRRDRHHDLQGATKKWAFVLAGTALLAVALPLNSGGASRPSTVLDPGFGVNGVVTTATAPGAGADLQNGLALQRDGRILVGGESEVNGGFAWRITRYTRDGTLDDSFGNGGTVLTNMSSVGGFDERLISIAVQRDGKIVAAGFVLTGPDSQDSALARYNVDGSLDTAFGTGGKVVTNVASEPSHDFINKVLIDHKGRIVVAGGCARIFVGRYLPDGTLDPSFDADGARPGLRIDVVAQEGETGAELLGLAIDHHGRLIGAGYATVLDAGSEKVNTAVVRYTPDGRLDPSFNTDGPHPGTVITSIAPDGGWNVAFRVAIDDHDRVLTAGDAFVGVGAGLYDIALSRYTPAGTIDRSFGTSGTTLVNGGRGDSDDDAQGLLVQPDNSIIVGGSAAPTAFTLDSDFMVARFLPDGALDASFGERGIAKTPTAPGVADDEIWAIALQREGKVIASGECDQPVTGRDVCVARYDVAPRGPA